MSTVPIEYVRVRAGRRPLRPEKVHSLADSIRDIGLQNPIVVREDWTLVSGAHRLEAFRQLGLAEIPYTLAPTNGRLFTDDVAELVAELQEIDENLQRADLTALEQGEAIARRKAVYEELHPEARSVRERGGPGRGHKNEGHNAPGFASETANVASVNESTVKRAAQVGSMPEAIRDAVIQATQYVSDNLPATYFRHP